MNKTDIEKWKRIAERTRKFQTDLAGLLYEMNHANIPKSVAFFQYTRMEDSLYKFQNLMEERAEQEHPNNDLEFYYERMSEKDE